MCVRVLVVAVACVLGSLVGAERASNLEDWPEFRGPTGQGLAPQATPPLSWGADVHVAWKTPLPGAGWSSPVVYQGRVYLTTALENDAEQVSSLRALCVDGTTGDVVWNTEVFPVSERATKHPKNGYASPTPIVSAGKVYVHFGPMGTACLDTAGTVLWRQQGLAYETPHGNGGSPVLSEGKLIFSCDDSKSPFVVALDQETGKVAWKVARNTEASKKFSFGTPLVIEEDGRKLAVSTGSGYVGAYDVNDGTEVWRVHYGEGFSIVPRPVLSHGLVFVTTGFIRPCSIFAIRTGGRGDVTNTHVAWQSGEGSPNTPSMVAVGDELYFVSDRGEFSCVDIASGRVHWQEDIGGKYSASLVYADGRIYATSEAGDTTVVKAATTFEKLAENSLGETTFASPALCGTVMFVRTVGGLYRIEAG